MMVQIFPAAPYQSRYSLQPMEGTMLEQVFTQRPMGEPLQGRRIFLKKTQLTKDSDGRRFS